MGRIEIETYPSGLFVSYDKTEKGMAIGKELGKWYQNANRYDRDDEFIILTESGEMIRRRVSFVTVIECAKELRLFLLKVLLKKFD